MCLLMVISGLSFFVIAHRLLLIVLTTKPIQLIKNIFLISVFFLLSFLVMLGLNVFVWMLWLLVLACFIYKKIQTNFLKKFCNFERRPTLTLTLHFSFAGCYDSLRKGTSFYAILKLPSTGSIRSNAVFITGFVYFFQLLLSLLFFEPQEEEKSAATSHHFDWDSESWCKRPSFVKRCFFSHQRYHSAHSANV